MGNLAFQDVFMFLNGSSLDALDHGLTPSRFGDAGGGGGDLFGV